MADLRMVSLGLCDLRFLGCRGVIWARWLRSVRGLDFGGGGGDLGIPSSLRHRIGRRQRKRLGPTHRTEVSAVWDYSGLGPCGSSDFVFVMANAMSAVTALESKTLFGKRKGGRARRPSNHIGHRPRPGQYWLGHRRTERVAASMPRVRLRVNACVDGAFAAPAENRAANRGRGRSL